MLGIIVVTTSTHGEQLYYEGTSRRISLSNVVIPKAVHLSARTECPHAFRRRKPRMGYAMELMQNLGGGEDAAWSARLL